MAIILTLFMFFLTAFVSGGYGNQSVLAQCTSTEPPMHVFNYADLWFFSLPLPPSFLVQKMSH
jgi:hypothetical protein